MWPHQVDRSKDEAMRSIRCMELEAYAQLVSTLRAQGPLTPTIREFLREGRRFLKISVDRHKAEIRRAVNDERLSSIAYHLTNLAETSTEWNVEGSRSDPTLGKSTITSAASTYRTPQSAELERRWSPHPTGMPYSPSKFVPFPLREARAYKSTPKNKKRKVPPTSTVTSQTQLNTRNWPVEKTIEHSRGYRRTSTIVPPPPKRPPKTMYNYSPSPAPDTTYYSDYQKQVSSETALLNSAAPSTQNLILVSRPQPKQGNTTPYKDSLDNRPSKRNNLKFFTSSKRVPCSNNTSVDSNLANLTTSSALKEAIPVTLIYSKSGIKVVPTAQLMEQTTVELVPPITSNNLGSTGKPIGVEPAVPQDYAKPSEDTTENKIPDTDIIETPLQESEPMKIEKGHISDGSGDADYKGFSRYDERRFDSSPELVMDLSP